MLRMNIKNQHNRRLPGTGASLSSVFVGFWYAQENEANDDHKRDRPRQEHEQCRHDPGDDQE
jgi:hypothetical protein